MPAHKRANRLPISNPCPGTFYLADRPVRAGSGTDGVVVAARSVRSGQFARTCMYALPGNPGSLGVVPKLTDSLPLVRSAEL